MITVHIPPQMSLMAGGKNGFEFEAGNWSEFLHQLDVQAPMLRSQIFDQSGCVRQFVGLFVDDEQVTAPGEGALKSDSKIDIVMAVAGG